MFKARWQIGFETRIVGIEIVGIFMRLLRFYFNTIFHISFIKTRVEVKFNLAKSSWWGGMYDRLIRDQ